MKFFCLLYFFLLFGFDSATQTAVIKILPEIQIIRVDSIAFVIIKLENVQQLHAYSIQISYDPLLLKFQNLNRLDFLGGWQTFFFPVIDTISGTIRVDEAILGAFSQSGSGEVFKITFKAKTEGNCNLNVMSSDLRDLNNQNISVGISNALIQILPVVSVISENYHEAPKPELHVYPNPFNSLANIQFSVGSSEIISLKIYNVEGEEVFSYNLNLSNKSSALIWDGRNNIGYPLPSGIYFIRLDMLDNFLIKKAILLK